MGLLILTWVRHTQTDMRATERVLQAEKLSVGRSLDFCCTVIFCINFFTKIVILKVIFADLKT